MRYSVAESSESVCNEACDVSATVEAQQLNCEEGTWLPAGNGKLNEETPGRIPASLREVHKKTSAEQETFVRAESLWYGNELPIDHPKSPKKLTRQDKDCS